VESYWVRFVNIVLRKRKRIDESIKQFIVWFVTLIPFCGQIASMSWVVFA